MSVAQTSLRVYFGEVKPKLGDHQLKVLTALQMSKRPVCDRELADYLGWPINTITNRRGELVAMEKVEEAFKAKYPKTNRLVSYWQVVKDKEMAHDCE